MTLDQLEVRLAKLEADLAEMSKPKAEAEAEGKASKWAPLYVALSVCMGAAAALAGAELGRNISEE